MKDECRPANWRSSNNKRAPLWPAAFFRSRFPFAGQTHTQLLIRADGAEAGGGGGGATLLFAHLRPPGRSQSAASGSSGGSLCARASKWTGRRLAV